MLKISESCISPLAFPSVENNVSIIIEYRMHGFEYHNCMITIIIIINIANFIAAIIIANHFQGQWYNILRDY